MELPAPGRPDRLGQRLLRLILPPLCPGCSRAVESGEMLCGRCMAGLNRAAVIRADPPEDVDAIVSCAPHEGVARQLLAAYKFRRVTSLGRLISGYMADLAGPVEQNQVVVPVPANRIRKRIRGFDPAELLAGDIAASLEDATLRLDLLARHGMGRQRGTGRSRRLGNPPDIRPTEAAPGIAGRPVLLVDDVITTGATLSAAARSVRRAGSGPVRAITFTRRL